MFKISLKLFADLKFGCSDDLMLKYVVHLLLLSSFFVETIVKSPLIASERKARTIVTLSPAYRYESLLNIHLVLFLVWLQHFKVIVIVLVAKRKLTLRVQIHDWKIFVQASSSLFTIVSPKF